MKPMREDAKEQIQNLTGHNKWLFDHMITAFWHGFGISNGLDFHKEDFEEVHYRKGTPRVAYRIKQEVMQAKLEEYIKWLESYKKSWDKNDSPHGYLTDNEDLYQPCHESRLAITRMLELLQI